VAKISKLPKVTTLGEVRGQRPVSLVRMALYHRFRINVHGCAVHYDDTVATYQINTDDRLTKTREKEAKLFVEGVLAGLRAAGVI
jgi:hypothetical protein